MKKTPLRSAIAVGACALVAFVGAGCGGDDDNDATTQNETVATTVATTATDDTTSTTFTSDTDSSDTTSATPDNPTQQFVGDMLEFGRTLQTFGTDLQSAAAGEAEGLRNKADELRGSLDKLDEIRGRMDSYTLDNAEMESRRAAIVDATPEVTRLGRELIDAGVANDKAKVQQVSTEFVNALQKLSQAASGGGSTPSSGG